MSAAQLSPWGGTAKWFVLLTGLALTLGAWHWLQADDASLAQERFEIEASEALEAIRSRMHAVSQLLRGGGGLFAVSEKVSRTVWRQYVESLQFEQSYPGIQGIGYALHIPPAALEQHQRQVRSEGFGDYRVRPAGEREVYTAIVYIEPFSSRNLQAFGYDMFSEPVRRAAMERARDEGRIAISGKVTLVQESGREVQAGFLMYLPVYRNGVAADTPEERRAALLGYVYSPFRMNDFMFSTIMRGLNIGVEVFDGERAAPQALLYATGRLQPRRRHERIETLALFDHRWTLRFSSLAGFEAKTSSYRPQLVLLLGVTVSLLLFAMTHMQNAAQRGIQASEERFRVAVDAAPNAMIMMERDGRITLANAEAARLFGYTKAELIGMEVERLVPQRLRAAHPGHRTRFFDDPQPRAIGARLDLYGLRKDGSEVPVEIGLNPIRLTGKLFVLASIIDITARQRATMEIRQLNETLEQRAAALEAANKELEAFSYSVSHDLRAPLRAIDGFSRLVLEKHGAQADGDTLHYLQRVRANAQQMGTLIDDLLAFSRLGRQQLSVQSVGTAALVRHCLDTLRAADGGERLAGAAVTVGELPACSGDPGLLREVWMNLLSNAFKFSGKHAAPRIAIGSSATDNGVAYFVRDNGAGFDMRHADKLFGVFQRLHTVREFPGTGVGLALVQRIVQRHGGRIWAEAQPGHGATFYFTLGENHVQS